jgi:hypothetical protein
LKLAEFNESRNEPFSLIRGTNFNTPTPQHSNTFSWFEFCSVALPNPIH